MRDLDAYYILDGKTVLKVGRENAYRWWEKNMDKRRVAQTDVGDFWVSTVFLMHDHNYCDDGPPIVFETMVFRRKDGEIYMGGEHTDRCSSYTEAEQMHKRICDEVRAGKMRSPNQ